MESCEEERSVLKRRLSASAVEIEKQVNLEFGEHRLELMWCGMMLNKLLLILFLMCRE
jgi:hypothetical protein